MYIGEVIRRAQSYYPSEYDINEMYSWCDEVSSMLAIEDRNVFVKEILYPDSKGQILLPANVGFENVISVSADGKNLKKEDLRTAESFKNCSSQVEIVYLKPYSPIRTAVYEDDVFTDRTKSCITVNKNLFRKGDSVIITTDDFCKEAHILKTEYADGLHMLYIAPVIMADLPETDFMRIERIVTEKTVCDAPYDVMYIDYIIAKICMYQRDFGAYNQFMTCFNSRLNAYKKWITNQLPQAGGRLKNRW